MRVALVHDWLVAQRGGENVLLELAKLFPDAPIYTLVHQPEAVHPAIEAHPIRTSFIQRLPGGAHRFRRYLPLFPLAIDTFDLSGFDLIVSTSHCVAKAAPTRAGQRHIAYIHTPMRYLWDQLPHYLPANRARRFLEPAARLATIGLRAWDARTAGRPTSLVANSAYVARRIRRVWNRSARVLYPPVDVDYFAAAQPRQRRGFLVVSALVPYKRVDLAVRTASEHGFQLTVVGAGPERERLEALSGPTVRFVGPLDREQLREAYASSEGLLFCGVEDFGIVPVEAMAAGCPVVAYADGGATETVVGYGAKRTGVFFDEPSTRALAFAMRELEKYWQAGCFSADVLSRRARRFDVKAFKAGFRQLLET